MEGEEYYNKLEERIGYHFNDRQLLKTALTHRSIRNKESYERLEFLGDRLLGLVIAEALYKRFPKEGEGFLSRRLASAVSRNSIASIAENWALEDKISISEELRAQGFGKQASLQADICEALLAAIYLDGGMDALKRVILANWYKVIKDKKARDIDTRSRLQEWCQARKLPLPLYKTTNTKGPAHKPIFTITVSLDDGKGLSAQAIASSKKTAMQQAATALLTQLTDNQS